ncbi:MAG TPA: thioesterase family protein [Chloroflexia bacterium]|nr:thioesterase family protein [Chloroflexia bacterium]
MVRKYRWTLRVRSYEGDAWGQVPAAGLLRYLEQSAIDAAADAGYGREFHQQHNSAWVIRRMTLIAQAPARPGDDLEITTWLSHFAKVRGGREYQVRNAGSGEMLAMGLAEWVYINRQTMVPIAIPPELGKGFDVPGAPIGSYDLPDVGQSGTPAEFTYSRRALWHETDSMEHINNAVYADWLDEAVRSSLDRVGWGTARLKEMGFQLRGEYYNLDYKRAAVPGMEVAVSTSIVGVSGRLCSVRQAICDAEGRVLLAANSVYGWRDNNGEPCAAPEGWGIEALENAE